jgi:glycogen debranching enzyme
MTDLIRVLCKGDLCHLESDPRMMEEWLVTNGLGGYASGTVTGAITRRYHGLLIAALPNRPGRMMMLNGLSERLRLPDRRAVYTGAADLPVLRLIVHGPSTAFTFERKETSLIPYRTERDRGYEWQGSLWSPGYFRSDLGEGDRTTLVASTEGWDTIRALSPEGAFRAELDRRKLLLDAAPPQAQTGPAAELVLAADQFLITPIGRLEDARVRVPGEEIRTVIAGYPWFTDWGRDTMISLEGLTLMTGRGNEAARILRTFAHYVRDGLIPNMFPEGETDGVYHTADATLWFFHAIHRYVRSTNDRPTLKLVLPKLVDIIEHHRNVTLDARLKNFTTSTRRNETCGRVL